MTLGCRSQSMYILGSCGFVSQPASLGNTIQHTYTEAFRTHVFSALPASFTRGFKALIASTFDLAHTATPPEWLVRLFPLPPDGQFARADALLWAAFDRLGMQERYESLISGVCYEYIETHILETCEKEWDQPMLATTREWMIDNIVPWMVLPYARNARNREISFLLFRNDRLTRLSSRGKKTNVARYRIQARFSRLQDACRPAVRSRSH